MSDPLVTRYPWVSAREIADSVHSGTLDSSTVVLAALRRIEELDGELNAFTVVFEEAALADAATMSPSRLAGPLAGVPVAIKDHIWVAGAPATNGSLALRDFVPDVDCAAVERLRAAGAIIIGKTNNPEFCYRGDTDSPTHGLTRNPYDLGRTPGGSSGGSAAAVSAGLATLAMGTDGGGSIRGPSAFCGIVGHKPTFGLVPTRPGFRGWPTLSVHGPMGRSVHDVATMLDVMAGEHPADPSTFPAERMLPLDWMDLSGLKVAFSENFGFARVEAEVGALFSRASRVIESLGCTVVDVQVPATNAIDLWTEIAATESYASEGEFLAHEDELTPYSVEMLRRGERVTARGYLDAQEQRRELVQSWREVFESVDLVISPGAAVTAGRIEEAEADSDDDWWGMEIVANLTGHPSTALPCGVTENGLPAGVQIMGRRYADRAVLAAAAVIEQAMPKDETADVVRGHGTSKFGQPV